MANAIDNSQDSIDSRDVIERVEELVAERDALIEAVNEATEAFNAAEEARDEADKAASEQSDTANEEKAELAQELFDEASDTLNDAVTSLNEWNNESDEGKELVLLLKLAEEGSNASPDWEYGSQLIRESYFEQAMDEMVADCYELPKDLPFWMNITYDYDALKQDYTSVDFDGVEYYVR